MEGHALLITNYSLINQNYVQHFSLSYKMIGDPLQPGKPVRQECGMKNSVSPAFATSQKALVADKAKAKFQVTVATCERPAAFARMTSGKGGICPSPRNRDSR
jgi:hypothetical protein